MTEGGRYTHPSFVEIGSNKPLFVHRRGSNVVHGQYFVDYSDRPANAHYEPKHQIDVAALRADFAKLVAMPEQEATAGSPLLPGRHAGPGNPESISRGCGGR
mgnify:CR=1 FL=1